MTVRLSPIVNIEIIVNDAESTYGFLHKVFGAEVFIRKYICTHLSSLN
jgi:hypothetical protein